MSFFCKLPFFFHSQTLAPLQLLVSKCWLVNAILTQPLTTILLISILQWPLKVSPLLCPPPFQHPSFLSALPLSSSVIPRGKKAAEAEFKSRTDIIAHTRGKLFLSSLSLSRSRVNAITSHVQGQSKTRFLGFVARTTPASGSKLWQRLT